MSTKSRQWLVATLLLVALPVVAEEPIDEIVVTADFRERPLTEIPSSVTVMDAEFIEAAAVQHFEELVNRVPNLNWSGDGHRARYFQIRGVGELEQYQGAPNPSVGFLVDDIDFSGIGGIATLFDVQSVEVLRGSQGSRYGANALGGLIYIRSTEPSAEADNRVQVGAGDDDAFFWGAAFGGALNERQTATARVSVHRHRSNGFRDNSYLDREDTNGRDESSVRARLRFEPGAAFSADVALIYSNVDNGYDGFSLDNSYTMLSDKPGKDAQESVGGSLRLDWPDLGGGSLTSITAAASSDIEYSFDADWGNDDSWAPVVYDYLSLRERERATLSQELRYVAGDWLFGLYALRLTDKLDTVDQGEYDDSFFVDTLDQQFDSDYESTNLALFAQHDRSFGDDTRLSAGLRIERRTTDYTDSDGLSAAPSETLWGGELGISHDLGDTLTAYASISKGYKASGFNLGTVPDDTRFFGDEALWSVEIGVKTLSLRETLSLNASVFHHWRVDQQVRTSFQIEQGDPTSFGFATIGIDEARALGVEAELNWMPHRDWEFYASAGLLDATFEKIPPIQELARLLGRNQAHAPTYTLAGGVSYRRENGLFARLDVTARDEFYFDVSHDQKSNSFALANLRFGYENENWLAAVWIRNLFDRTYAVRGFYFGNEPPDFVDTLYTRLGDPRQAGITIERRF